MNEVKSSQTDNKLDRNFTAGGSNLRLSHLDSFTGP